MKMNIRTLGSLVVGAMTALNAGCPSNKSSGDDAKSKAEAPAAGSLDPLCMAKPSTAPEEKLEIGGKTYKRQGSTVSLEGADADDEFLIGQISDIKDHNADNAQNLQAILGWMKQENVDAIAVTGDLGETQDSIEKVLRDVAAPGLPVLVIIGNRECRDHFDAAVRAVQKDFKNIINMNQVRVFNTDDASFVSLPGYYNRGYLHCAKGCDYLPADAAALVDVAKAATAPVRVLISHGPPLMSGALAIDRIHEGANVGSPSMAEVMKNNPQLFPFGMFGNIEEAGGYATDLNGAARVAAESYADSFYLNPGPADAVRWSMLDGSESRGMAGVIKVKGKQAMYKIFHVSAGNPAAPAGGPSAPAAAGAPAPAAGAAPEKK